MQNAPRLNVRIGAPVFPLRKLCFAFMFALLGGVASGVLSALFLGLLDRVGVFFQLNPFLVLGLPIGGGLGYLVFRRYGRGVEAGTSLILQVFHEKKDSVPFRMAPLVLLGTLLTHFFGGSVGREGTAVQMSVGALVGGSQWFGFGRDWNRHMIVCGISGGFGAVFGTPFAGAIYAMEMPMNGTMQWRYLPFCLISSMVGHWVCLACGVIHSQFPKIEALPVDSWRLWTSVVVAGCVFGCCGRLFLFLQRQIVLLTGAIGFSPMSRVLVISAVVALLGSIEGMQGYLGLGVDSINPKLPSLLGSFSPGAVSAWSWLWKLLFTGLTLAAGFRGGEVTPLFFVGAAIGNVTASTLGWPEDYFAALGMAAVFFGACHCPLAGCIMGIELFGTEMALPLFLCSQISHWVCLGEGLYLDQ